MRKIRRRSPQVIVVAGPTASGKTAFAVALADAIGGEIISADSRQVYRHLDVGTGKPDSEQLSRIPHHMISCINPDDVMTADRFARESQFIMDGLRHEGKSCLIVGGTGLWIRALVDGLSELPPADDAFRENMKQIALNRGTQHLHTLLKTIDPESAHHLHPSDQLRIIRALEIHHLTGKTASQLRLAAKSEKRIDARWIGIEVPRETLYQRAETRIDNWMGSGWFEEVQYLVKERSLTLQTPAMQALGYSHLARHLDGDFDLESAVSLIKRDTRRYIKRQLTWFRAEKRMVWLPIIDDQEQAVELFIKANPL